MQSGSNLRIDILQIIDNFIYNNKWCDYVIDEMQKFCKK